MHTTTNKNVSQVIPNNVDSKFYQQQSYIMDHLCKGKSKC